MLCHWNGLSAGPHPVYSGGALSVALHFILHEGYYAYKILHVLGSTVGHALLLCWGWIQPESLTCWGRGGLLLLLGNARLAWLKPAWPYATSDWQLCLFRMWTTSLIQLVIWLRWMEWRWFSGTFLRPSMGQAKGLFFCCWFPWAVACFADCTASLQPQGIPLKAVCLAILNACLTTMVMISMRPMVVAHLATCQTAHIRVSYSLAQHVALWLNGALQLIWAIGESTCLSESSWQNRFTLRTGIHNTHCTTTGPKSCNVCQCKSGPTCCALHLMSSETLKIVVGSVVVTADPFCGVAVLLEKKRKKKTTPFGVNLMRNQVLYRAAQAVLLSTTVGPARSSNSPMIVSPCIWRSVTCPFCVLCMLAHSQTLSDALVWYMWTSDVPNVPSANPATHSAKCAHIRLAMLLCMGAARI